MIDRICGLAAGQSIAHGYVRPLGVESLFRTYQKPNNLHRTRGSIQSSQHSPPTFDSKKNTERSLKGTHNGGYIPRYRCIHVHTTRWRAMGSPLGYGIITWVWDHHLTMGSLLGYGIATRVWTHHLGILFLPLSWLNCRIEL